MNSTNSMWPTTATRVMSWRGRGRSWRPAAMPSMSRLVVTPGGSPLLLADRDRCARGGARESVGPDCLHRRGQAVGHEHRRDRDRAVRSGLLEELSPTVGCLDRDV